jgi:hypothetical protein
MKVFDVMISAGGDCAVTQRGTTITVRRAFATGGAMAYWIANVVGPPAGVEFALHSGPGASEGLVDDMLTALEDSGYRIPRARRIRPKR